MKRLQKLLEDYRSGGSFPTYEQLAEIAYGNQLHIPTPPDLVPVGSAGLGTVQDVPPSTRPVLIVDDVSQFFAHIRTTETGRYSGNNPTICITDEGEENAPQTNSR